MIKSFVFVLIVMWIVFYKGYDCIFIFEGISKVIIEIVVYLLLVVLGFDFILIVVMFIS